MQMARKAILADRFGDFRAEQLEVLDRLI